MMWNTLEKISDQVGRHSTFLGQLYYIIIFVFRLIVVATIGSSVYADEQSQFRCSSKIVGCTNLCYDKFAKISHLRFWSFQLLAVLAPTVFFHFYAKFVSGEIEKLKRTESQLKCIDDGEMEKLRLSGNSICDKDFRKLLKRRESIGDIKVRKIYAENELKEVLFTNKVRLAYYCSVVLRMGVEAVFLFFSYQLFYQENPWCKGDAACNGENNPLHFLWLRVNGGFTCRIEGGDWLSMACLSHGEYKNGYIPCFVSRPFEKTLLLRYMNILSAVCFVISGLELILLTMKAGVNCAKPALKRKRKPVTLKLRSSPDFPFPPTTIQNFPDTSVKRLSFPTVSVPINMPTKYSCEGEKIPFRQVRLRDPDKDDESVRSYV